MRRFYEGSLNRMKHSIKTPSVSFPNFSDAINISIINIDFNYLEEN